MSVFPSHHAPIKGKREPETRKHGTDLISFRQLGGGHLQEIGRQIKQPLGICPTVLFRATATARQPPPRVNQSLGQTDGMLLFALSDWQRGYIESATKLPERAKRSQDCRFGTGKSFSIPGPRHGR